MTKICPFSDSKICNDSCPLFVSPKDLNEFVVARLCSLGVFDKENGVCSLKLSALSHARTIFENTRTRV